MFNKIEITFSIKFNCVNFNTMKQPFDIKLHIGRDCQLKYISTIEDEQKLLEKSNYHENIRSE